MPVQNRFLGLAFCLFCFSPLLRAQKETATSTLMGFQGSYVSMGMVRAQESGITDQRRTYLQAFAMRPLASRQQFGIHLAYLESSIDQVGLPEMKSPFVLERNRALNLGCIHRYTRPLLRDVLQLFFQSTVDFESTQRRTVTMGETLLEKGLGARYQLRPGISYKISKDASLEFGFGLLNLNTIQFFEPTISGGSRTSTQSNLDVSFGVTSLFLGFTFKL